MTPVHPLPVLQLPDLLELAYSRDYLSLGPRLDLLVAATGDDALEIFLSLFNLLYDRLEQVLQLLVLLLHGLRPRNQQLVRRLPVLLLVVLEGPRSDPADALASPPLAIIYGGQQRRLLLHRDVRVELLLVFELKTLLKLVDHLLAVLAPLARREHHRTLFKLLLKFSLNLFPRTAPRDEVNRMVLLASSSNRLRVLDDSLLRALLLLLRGPLGRPSRPRLDRWVIDLDLLWRRVKRE